jgi:hypothetical protein
VNPAKSKGDRAERELGKIFSELSGFTVRRKLGAGRLDDSGDLEGLPQTCLQAKDHVTYDRIPSHIRQLEIQRQNAGCPFAALLTRYRGGIWIAHMSTDHLLTLHREATD